MMVRSLRSLTAAVITVACATFVACGSDDSTSESAATSAPTETSDLTLVRETGPPSTVPIEVPDVALPDPIPTELVVTEVTPGDGPEAADGDVVLVNYVGVRSEDGTQFDSNFGADPFAVVLGQGGVIPGWDQGLVGAQAGERLQLDIPNDLAYGDQPQGDVIQAGDALSFVIDVSAVGRAAAPPVATDLPIGAEPATELVIDDARVGDGAALEEGQQTYLHLVAARGDTGEVLQSTWEQGGPQPIMFAEGGTVPFLLEGLTGMQVGGRRILTVPFEQAFGPEGSGDLGVPDGTDVIVVADLLVAY